MLARQTFAVAFVPVIPLQEDMVPKGYMHEVLDEFRSWDT